MWFNNLICKFPKNILPKYSHRGKQCYRNYLIIQHPILPVSEFHTCTQLYYKIYDDFENNACYNIMLKNREKYSLSNNEEPVNDVITTEEFENIVNTMWDKKSPTEILDAFIKCSDYAAKHSICISSSKFDHFVDKLTDSFMEMSKEQLETVFSNTRKWPETESIKTRNFLEIWTALDHVCREKLQYWDAKTKLLFADYFYRLNLAKYSDFVSKILWKFSLRTHQLTPHLLIQTLFTLGLCRWSPKQRYNFEERMDKCFDELTLEEISIFCIGFFKSQTIIKNPNVYTKLIDRTIENASTIDDVPLCAILKLIQYSSELQKSYKIKQLSDILADEVDRLSFLCCMHLVTLGVPTRTKSTLALNAVMKKFKENPSQARTKDLERLTLAFSMFNIDKNTGVYDLILNELRQSTRHDEINKYPYAFVDCISFLHEVDIYPEDLMNYALSEKIESTVLNNPYNQKGNRALNIDGNVELFCENYKGNRLSTSKKEQIVRARRVWIPNEEVKGNLLLNIAASLEILLLLKALRDGSENIVATHIFPEYQRPDLIICDSEDGKPLPVTQSFSPNSVNIQYRPDDENKWFVFQIMGKNAFIHDSTELVGSVLKKNRMFEKLGFTSIMIVVQNWVLLDTEKEKLNYLMNVCDNYNIYYNKNLIHGNNPILSRKYVFKPQNFKNVGLKQMN